LAFLADGRPLPYGRLSARPLFTESVKFELLIYIGSLAKFLTVFVNNLTCKLSENGFARDTERREKGDWAATLNKGGRFGGVFLRSGGCQANWHWIDNLISGCIAAKPSAMILTRRHSRKSGSHLRLGRPELRSSSRSGLEKIIYMILIG